MVLSKPRKRVRYQKAVRHMEMLETRRLMSATLTIEPETTTGISALGGAYDPDTGHLWVVNGADLVNINDSTVIPGVIAGSYNGGMLINDGHAYLSDGLGGIRPDFFMGAAPSAA